MEPYQIALLVIACVIVFLFLVWLIFGIVLFNFALARKKVDDVNCEDSMPCSEDKKYKLVFDHKWIDSKIFETVSIKSYDHLKLISHVTKDETTHTWVIACHGYHGHWKETTTQVSALNKSMPLSVLFIEERANLKSQGHYMTMGWKERLDIIGWINYVISLDKDCKIVLLGQSMGASSVMCALGEQLPSNVKCAICDCGFSSIYDEFNDVVSYFIKKGNPKFIMWTLRLFAKVFLHIDIKKNTMTSQLSKSITPILFIHGEGDTFVQCKNLDVNYTSVKQGTYKEQLKVPVANHALSFYYNPEGYTKQMTNFVNRFIK